MQFNGKEELEATLNSCYKDLSDDDGFLLRMYAYLQLRSRHSMILDIKKQKTRIYNNSIFIDFSVNPYFEYISYAALFLALTCNSIPS